MAIGAQAIIFDAYGTLIDTKDGSVRATAAILRKRGVELDPIEVYARWKQLHHEHMESLEAFYAEADIFLLDLKRLYTEYGIQGSPEEDVRIMLSTLGARGLFAETLQVVRKLRERYRIYIASTTDEQPLLSDLRRSGLHVHGIYTSQRLQLYKPRKEFFLRVLSDIRLHADQVVYVGDSLRDDVFGPQQVGIRSVWVNRKNRPLGDADPVPDYQIRDLRELLPLLGMTGP